MTHEMTTLDVIGMHCTGCEQRVSRVLAQLPGVRVKRVDHQRGEVEIRFNIGQTSLEDVRQRIEQLGYQVER